MTRYNQGVSLRERVALRRKTIMLPLADADVFHKHQQGAKRLCDRFWLPMLLFGSLGAITWAIRGTDGWGGIDGTLVPGLTWGILWGYCCHRAGVDARGVVLWLGLGLALGGELGYGQYVSWIQGRLHTVEDVVHVSPWIGFAWFIICGIGWGAPGGVVLGWALNPHISTAKWSMRVVFMLALIVLIFNLPLPGLGTGAVTGLGDILARYWPGPFFPRAELGLYEGEMQAQAVRTVYTNTQNLAVLVWWLCALIMAVFHRDRTTFAAGCIIGGGFGIGFSISALWCLGYSVSPGYIDWWKMWELHAGFNLGILYLLLLLWTMRRITRTLPPAAHQAPLPSLSPVAREIRITLFLGFAGFVLVFAAAVEYFPWAGLLAALLYPSALFMVTWRGCMNHGWQHAPEMRKRVSLVYTVFLLIFMLLHGGTSRMGVVLGLYDAQAADQYAWPPARIALFVLPAAVLLIATLNLLRKSVMPGDQRVPHDPRLPIYMTDLFMFIGVIGAVSIWPEKIGVLYALFLFLALAAFTRMNRRYDTISTAQ